MRTALRRSQILTPVGTWDFGKERKYFRTKMPDLRGLMEGGQRSQQSLNLEGQSASLNYQSRESKSQKVRSSGSKCPNGLRDPLLGGRKLKRAGTTLPRNKKAVNLKNRSRRKENGGKITYQKTWRGWGKIPRNAGKIPTVSKEFQERFRRIRDSPSGGGRTEASSTFTWGPWHGQGRRSEKKRFRRRLGGGSYPAKRALTKYWRVLVRIRVNTNERRSVGG